MEQGLTFYHEHRKCRCAVMCGLRWVRMDVIGSRGAGIADSTQLWSALQVVQGAIMPAVAQARRKAIEKRHVPCMYCEQSSALPQSVYF